ncbi:MAG: hypothetical protein NVS4B3_23770 [Gemmatimonadaceae bacterium]
MVRARRSRYHGGDLPLHPGTLFLTALLGSLLLPPAPLAGQQIAPLGDGAVVRVWSKLPVLTGRVGTVVRQGNDTLWLEAKSPIEPLTVPFLTIDRLELQRLSGSRWGHVAVGATLGLVGGALVGGAIGYNTTCAHCDGDLRPLGALFGGAEGGLLGSLIGGFIGASRPTYRWAPVVLGGR